MPKSEFCVALTGGQIVNTNSSSDYDRRKLQIRRAIQFIWLIIVTAFVAHYVWKHWQELSQYDYGFQPGWLVCALGLDMMRRLLGGLRWTTIILADVAQPKPVDYRYHLRTFFLSNLASYLPGSLWHMVVRVQMNRAAGVSVQKTSAAAAYDVVVMIWGASFVGLCGAVEILDLPVMTTIALLTLICFASFIIVHPRVIKTLSRRLTSLLGKDTGEIEEMQISTFWGIKVLTLSASIWVFSGLSLFCILRAVQDAELNISLPYLTSLFAMAWLIGFVTPWAPSGLGVRDGILIWGLVRFVPHPIALVATIASRLVIALADLIWTAIAASLSKRPTPPSHETRST